MSVVALAVGGSALVGAYSAKKSRDAASAANDAAIQANAWQGEIAKDQYDEYKTTYRPLERKMVKDAQEYDSPEAYDKAASEAQATTSQQIALAQDRLSRQPGLDPSSAASQAAQSRLALTGAAMGASAQNQAREGVRDKAWARKMDSLGLGKNLVTNASNGFAQNARTAASLSSINNQQASNTAAGVGSMVNGLANLGIRAYETYTANNPPGASNPNQVNADGQTPTFTDYAIT